MREEREVRARKSASWLIEALMGTPPLSTLSTAIPLHSAHRSKVLPAGAGLMRPSLDLELQHRALWPSSDLYSKHRRAGDRQVLYLQQSLFTHTRKLSPRCAQHKPCRRSASSCPSSAPSTMQSRSEWHQTARASTPTSSMP